MSFTENLKLFLKKAALIILIMTVIPNIIFILFQFLTDFTLNPIVYVIATITGMTTICYQASSFIYYSKENKYTKYFFMLLFSCIIPILFVYGIAWVAFVSSDKLLTVANVAEAYFGYIFSMCVNVGFGMLLPQKIKNQMSPKIEG